jgi:hypothetical protein
LLKKLIETSGRNNNRHKVSKKLVEKSCIKDKILYNETINYANELMSAE